MKFCISFFAILLILVSAFEITFAETKASDRLKPRWISKMPESMTSNSYFKIVHTDNGSDLTTSRLLAKKELVNAIEKKESISVEEQLDQESIQYREQGKEKESSNLIYSLKVKAEGVPVYIHYERIDEYWEEVYENGRHYFKLYTLFAVARKGMNLEVGKVMLTTKYGARGFVRSMFIPGWGQMYKGNTAKGITILSGEIALVGAIIISENLKSSYLKKMKENPKYVKSYNTKADNCENVRNTFIGAAAALYVYNLVDAIVANGSKRIVSDRAKRLSMMPIVAPDYSGIRLAWNF